MSVSGPSAATNPSPPRPAPDALDASRVRELWEDSIKGSIPSRRTRALLHDAQVLAVEGTSIQLSMPHAPLAKMLSDESNLGPIRTALQQALGGTWKVEVVVGGTAGESAAAAPVAPAAPEGSGSAASWSGEASTPRRPAPPDLAAQEPPEQPPPPEPDDPRDHSEPLGEPDPSTGRRVNDPEVVAEGLLRSQLGARPVDQP